MNVEVAVLRSPSLVVRAVCVAIKQTEQAAELRSYAVKVELAVLGPLSLTVCTVSVDVKQH